MEKPPVWAMIKDAIENLNGELTYSEIKEYINSQWENVNQDTITAQIIAVTVNHNSRIHYNENLSPRLSNSGSCYDLLYYLDRGKVVKYNPQKHGLWEIFINDKGKPQIRLKGNNAYLFAWNPNNWAFNELEEKIEEIKATGKTTIIWSIQSHKKVRIGDRAFIVRLGSKENGIFASGFVISEPYLLPHWSEDGTLVHRVTIELDVLLSPKNSILDVNNLKLNVSDEQHWTPQKSGIQIKNEIVSDLEKIWFDFINMQSVFLNIVEQSIIEGTSYQLSQTIYERNRYARTLCLQHHGYSCTVCNFNFKNVYGDIGINYIHVHHLNQLSVTGQRATNPINDLRPVCPNCHAMLHKKNPPFSIEELKGMLNH